MSNPQHEPTMEEILASIRKIISEDAPEGGAPAPEPVAEAAASPPPAPPPPAPPPPPPPVAAALDELRRLWSLTEQAGEAAPLTMSQAIRYQHTARQVVHLLRGLTVGREGDER